MPKLFPKAVFRSCFPKFFPNAPLQSGCPKAVAPKRLPQSGCPKAAMLQTYSPKLFSKAAPESCSPKLLPKVATESCSPKLRFKAISHRCSSFKAAPPQSCSEQLLSLPRKIVSESGFPKLLSKAIPQTNRFSKQLSVNAAFKAASCSPQLLPKAALQSCYRKPRPKNAPQNSNAVTRSCFKAGPESCQKLLPKAAAQSCSPALLPKVVPQSCSPKLLP